MKHFILFLTFQSKKYLTLKRPYFFVNFFNETILRLKQNFSDNLKFKIKPIFKLRIIYTFIIYLIIFY